MIRFSAAAIAAMGEHADAIMMSHQADLGRIAVAWNSLHETAGHLLAAIAFPQNREQCLAVWNAIRSDRDQREALMAAAAASLASDSRLLDEIRWACRKAEGLEDSRNNAVHAPYALSVREGQLAVLPSTTWGHRRARKLAGLDLSLEFRSYAERIDALKKFLRALLDCVGQQGDCRSWPDRPSLPQPARSTTRKVQRPKTRDR